MLFIAVGGLKIKGDNTESVESLGLTGVDIEKNFTDYINSIDNDWSNYYEELLQFPFKKSFEIGRKLPYYNGAKRIDILRDRKCFIVKNPLRFINIVRYLQNTLEVNPSHGIMIKAKSSPASFVHLIMEFENGNSIGIIFHDTQRPLQINQIYNAQKAQEYANLDGIVLIIHKIGLPAKKHIKVINDESEKKFGKKILEVVRYDEIQKQAEKLVS